jgi:hypothetical protein
MLNLFKSPRKCLVFILPILFIIPGCGGGGGDDGGGGGTPPPTVPTVLNYSVGSSTMTPLLTGIATTQGGDITFTVTAISLTGTYNRDTGATTLNESNGMAFTMNPSPLGGTLTAGIYTAPGSTGKWISGQDPTEGKLSVDAGSGLITIQVNNLPGVDITYGNVTTSFTWSEFKDAFFDGTKVNDVRVASAAYNALQTVYRCVSQAYTLIDVVMKNQDTLTQSGIDVQLATSLSGFPSNLHVQWGGNSSGNISPGDNFLSRFSNWWVDNPGTNQDYFYNGRLLWLNYWEGTNSSGNFVGGDFKIGITGDEFFEEEVNSGAPDLGTRITYKESGFLFLLSWQ